MVMCVSLLVLVIAQAPASPTALMAEVRAQLDAPQTPERMQRIEALLTELRRVEDSVPEKHFLDTRFGLHTEMLERYRAVGDLARLRPHAEWLDRFEHFVHPYVPPAPSGAPDPEPFAPRPPDPAYLREIRKRHGAAFLAARIDVARALLADGARSKAIRSLETGERCLTDIPGAVKALKAERDRIRKIK